MGRFGGDAVFLRRGKSRTDTSYAYCARDQDLKPGRGSMFANRPANLLKVSGEPTRLSCSGETPMTRLKRAGAYDCRSRVAGAP
jgi:hypothetical protein